MPSQVSQSGAIRFWLSGRQPEFIAFFGVSNNLFHFLSWSLSLFLNARFTTGRENRTRWRVISSDSWFVRSRHVPIPVCLLGSLLRYCSCTWQLCTALWYLCLAWMATFSAFCPHHLLLTPRKDEEQAGELGKSQPGLGIPHTVYWCPWIYPVYICTLEKGSLSFILYIYQLVEKKNSSKFFIPFVFTAKLCIFCCGWPVQGSGAINNLFQALLYFLTNSVSDLAAPVKALIRSVSCLC